MTRGRTIRMSLVIMMVLLMTCPPQAVPAPAPWEMEWEKTLAAAKKEGTLMHLTELGAEQRRAIGEAFKTRFGIGIEWLAGNGSELGNKLLTERRAGIYSADTGLMGWSAPFTILKPAGALESLQKVLFLPELTDPREIQKVWRFRELDWVDKEHTLLSFASYASGALVINTQLVKPGEIKGYRDLLDPKWKGKIVLFDPTVGTGAGLTWFQAVGSGIMGWDYLRQLAKQEPFLSRDRRLCVEWVARGKSAVGLALPEPMVNEFIAIGAPLKSLLPEEGGYSVGGTSISIMLKNAPHANAAKLYVNWLLSKDGQTIYSKATGLPSGRLDVSTAGVKPSLILDPEKRYVRSFGEEVVRGRPEAVQKAKQIFGTLGK